MKISNVIFLIPVLPMLSHAELLAPTFNYNHATGTVSQVTIGDDNFEDFKGYDYSLNLSREFNPGTYLRISYIRRSIDDTVAYTGGDIEADVAVEGNGNAVAVVGGKAVGLSSTIDLYGEIGFGFSSFDLDAEILIDDATAATVSDSEDDTGVAAGVGLRVALDSSRKVELNPSFSFASGSGETSKSAGITLAIGLADNVQAGLGVSVDLDEDISKIGGGVRFYY